MNENDNLKANNLSTFLQKDEHKDEKSPLKENSVKPYSNGNETIDQNNLQNKDTILIVTDVNDKNNEEKISDETTKEIAYCKQTSQLTKLNQNKVEIQLTTYNQKQR